MSVGRLAAASVAASLFAAAAGAQTPGTLEVGGFGQYTVFDEDVFGADNEIGGGARVGFFFSPRWAIEGEGSYSKVDRPGINNDDVEKYSPLALRLNYNFPFGASSAFILGGGVTRSDYGTSYHFGPSAMAGARIGFGRVALRIDGVYNYLPSENVEASEMYLRAGLSALIPGSSPMSAEQQAQMGGAPQPGTVEVGGFGQYSIFDGDMNLDNAFGFGARIGGFVTPMIEPEVDFAYTEADQETGNLTNLHVVPIAARLNFNFPFGARNAFILGGGASRTFYQRPGLPYYRGVDEENNVGGAYNWGVSGLAGVRVGLGQRVALRLDGVADYLPEPKFANFAVRAGLSLLLGGARPAEPEVVATVDTTTPAPVDTMPTQPAVDSSAILAEQQRQQQEAARSALTAVIYFDFDRSNIRPDAASTLDAKIPYLQANPGMRIRIVGHTDARGSDEYNLALGQRRAASARRYLTQRGIDAGRIEITSRGEESPVVPNATTEAEHQQNRRDEFEIVVGGENIMVPGGMGGAMAPAAAPTDTTQMQDTTQMRDTTQVRDTTAVPPTPPSNTLAPTTDSLNTTTAPATEPAARPDSATVPSGTPTTTPATPATPVPATPTPTTPDTTGTPGTPPATPDTTGTPGTPTTPSTPPSTPPVR